MQLWYIFSELPYAMALSVENLRTHCSSCALDVPEGWIPCGKCDKIVYCNESCLQSDLPFHRSECIAFGQGKMDAYSDSTLVGVRMLGRLVERYNEDNGVVNLSFDFPNQTLKDRCFDDLMTHKKDLRQSSCHQQAFKDAKRAFYKFYAGTPIASVTVSRLEEFFCRLMINGFALNVRNKDQPSIVEDLGEVLYLNASRFNHSCRPSCLYKFIGHRLVIEYIDESGRDKPLALTKDEFENLTLQYGYGSFWNYNTSCPLTKQRIKSLKCRYFFQCNCVLCTDEIRDKIQLSAAPLECVECKSPYVWNQQYRIGPFSLKKMCDCNKGKSVNDENAKVVFGKGMSNRVKKLLRQWKNAMETTTEKPRPSRTITYCGPVAEMAEGIWHPRYNLRLGQVYEKLFCAMCELKFDDARTCFNGSENDLEVMLKWGEALLNVYTVYLEAYMVHISNYAQDVALLYKLRSKSTQDEERAEFWFQYAIDQWKQRGEMACAEMVEQLASNSPIQWTRKPEVEVM